MLPNTGSRKKLEAPEGSRDLVPHHSSSTSPWQQQPSLQSASLFHGSRTSGVQKTDSPGKKNSIGLFLWYEYTIVGDLKLLKFQQLAQKIPGNLTVGSPIPLLATSSPPLAGTDSRYPLRCSTSIQTTLLFSL